MNQDLLELMHMTSIKLKILPSFMGEPFEVKLYDAIKDVGNFD
jgi:hypothetical protein